MSAASDNWFADSPVPADIAARHTGVHEEIIVSRVGAGGVRTLRL
jgi:hypothetical protein